MRNLRQLSDSRIIRQGLGIVTGLIAAASSAHAHGGMAGPDDLGPPLFTSAALAFVCYWIVILWPAPKRKGSDHPRTGRKMMVKEDRRPVARSNKKVAPKQTSQLRRVHQSRIGGVSGSERKATDV